MYPGPTEKRTPEADTDALDIVIELESHDRALQAGLMLRALGHKLRTPLTGVTVGLELAAELLDDTSEGKELVQLAQDSARQLQRAVIGILEYVDAAQSQSRPRPLESIGPDELAASLHLPGEVELRCEVMDEICVDLQTARKSLRELIENARAAGAQTLSLTIEVAEDDHVVFALEDDGPGFPPDQAARLFEPYYQVDQSGEAPGIGLGLAILAREVQAGGGAVGAASDPEAPTTRVWFRLPQPLVEKP